MGIKVNKYQHCCWEAKGSSSKLLGTENDAYWLNKITFMPSWFQSLHTGFIQLSRMKQPKWKQSTSWNKARNHHPATLHLCCPLGIVCCTDYPFWKILSVGLKKQKYVFRYPLPRTLLNQIFTPGLASEESYQKKNPHRDVSCRALVKRSCKMEKESNTILVARILFGDLFPQSLLEKERGRVSYRTTSVERGQYRKWKDQSVLVIQNNKYTQKFKKFVHRPREQDALLLH